MTKIKDLTREELEQLYNKNEWLHSEINREAEKVMYRDQEEEFYLLGAKVFDTHNDYDSFYLTTPIRYGCHDSKSVAHKLCRDYMNSENAVLYDKLNELADKLDELDEDREEEQERIELELDKTCEELAAGLTEQLKAYENNYDEYVKSTLDWLHDSNSWYSELNIRGGAIEEIVYHH